jgi:hypothetical protein
MPDDIDDAVIEEFNDADPHSLEVDESILAQYDTADEPDEPESDTPEEPPEDPGALEQMKAQDAYTDRARKYLAKNMGDVYGDTAAEYTECPFCNYFGTPGWLHVEPCPPTLLGTLYDYAQVRAPDEYIPDIYSRVCERCNGLGSCASGSKVAGQERLSCIECAGQGWIAVGDERRRPGMYVPNGPTPLNPSPATDATGELAGAGTDPPEAEALRKRGWAVIPPMAA